MIRLYVENPLLENQDVVLTENQSHYLQKVMRLKENDDVLLFNGRDGEWKARITGTSKKSTILFPITQSRPQRREGDLWLLFSPLKPKRQEFLVEKATELGVSCLCLVHFERTSVPKVNFEKMQAHAREATEQCGRLTLPEIKPLMSLNALLKNWPAERFLLFGDESLSSPSLEALNLNPQKPYAFLVGPEGGFSPQELSLLKSFPQAQGVTLNPHILRAETAALVGVSYLQMKTQTVSSLVRNA
ncbi:MAG: 16S rRNA (uracil(1498)-N(3))-methyltransferase [Alphaproteobacteria bacterium 41-28]|nr:MAG: 16S rRNA (uracil(1498)-N(3))-methyltransferase [Alphaproteobacteria bacterium 41-28]